jgi:hypothetical protein
VKRPGPQLKMPEAKVPPVLKDLYRDLRDRRLLPVVGLLVVALVAVPILLSSSPPDPEPTAPVPNEIGATASAAGQPTVVKATPGLRNPNKRLSHLSPKDPFAQRYTNAPTAPDPTAVTTTTGGPQNSTTDAPSATGITSPSGSTEPAGPGPGAAPGNSAGSGEPRAAKDDDLTFYTYAVDVKIVRTETKANGRKQRDEPTAHEKVLPATSLPGEKAQVVTYMGVSPKTRKPLFLVSTDVTAVFGDAKCVAGSDSCQLLELEEDLPQTFVYGENGVRYKIVVLKTEPVVTGHP